MIEVQVRLFAQAADAAGVHDMAFELPAGARAADVLDGLCGRFPGLEALRETLRLAVNEAYALPDQIIDDGDHVAVIPPVSGG